TDGALVAAATLSNRYITDRFLPDKAIDLIDEAASRLRMQVDSKPEALDELDRRVIQLKIEREALKKEPDAASKDRLQKLENEAVREESIAAVVSRWTGVPVDKMLEGERAKLLRMEDELRKRVVGQEEALKVVSNAVRRARSEERRVGKEC